RPLSECKVETTTHAKDGPRTPRPRVPSRTSAPDMREEFSSLRTELIRLLVIPLLAPRPVRKASPFPYKRSLSRRNKGDFSMDPTHRTIVRPKGARRCRRLVRRELPQVRGSSWPWLAHMSPPDR